MAKKEEDGSQEVASKNEMMSIDHLEEVHSPGGNGSDSPPHHDTKLESQTGEVEERVTVKAWICVFVSNLNMVVRIEI